MSIDGDWVALTVLGSYRPVSSARTRMSFSLVAMTKRSMGSPMRLA